MQMRRLCTEPHPPAPSALLPRTSQSSSFLGISFPCLPLICTEHARYMIAVPFEAGITFSPAPRIFSSSSQYIYCKGIAGPLLTLDSCRCCCFFLFFFSSSVSNLAPAFKVAIHVA